MFITFYTGSLSVSLGWTEPNYWVGPQAALYQSFDGLDGIVLMEGSQEVCHNPLLAGKVKFMFRQMDSNAAFAHST